MVPKRKKYKKLSEWTDAEIRGMIDRFIQIHGRYPSTTDLRGPEMPPKRIFMPLYGVRPANWLLMNYGPSVPSCEERRRKYAEDFRKEYMRLKPRTSDEYNQKKDPAYPRWESIRKYYPNDFTCWTGMLEFFDLPRFTDPPKEPQHDVWTVEIVWHTKKTSDSPEKPEASPVHSPAAN